MRVIITTVGTWGDVLPFIGIGTELRKRGHEVVILANSKYEQDIRKWGLEFHSIGQKEKLEEALSYLLNEGLIWEKKNKKTAKIYKVIEACRTISLSATGPILEYASKHNKPGNTLLISNYICYGTRYVQDKLGIPCITTVLVPFYIRSGIRPSEQPGLSANAPRIIKRLYTLIFEDIFVLKPMFEKFKDQGIDLSKYKSFKHRCSPDKVICMAPDWFAKPQADWPAQTETVGFPFFEGEQIQELPQELVEFLNSGEPPVVFNPGSQVRKDDNSFVEESIKACRKLGMRGVFIALPENKRPVDLPPYMRAFGYVNLSLLLQRSAAMVHHGGIGNCAQGLRAGVPHLVVPVYAEHFDTAYRLKELGVGDSIMWDNYRDELIVHKLEGLLKSKETERNCKAIAQKFGTGNAIEIFCDIAENVALNRGITLK
ncbi:MAG: glycosyltransferase [Clostridia bacterium]|nr:glycosyltransferase [Clostridia bacterium]